MIEAALADKIAYLPAEASSVSGMSVKLIRLLCATDATFPAFNVGRRVLIPKREFANWLQSQAEMKIGMPEHIKTGRKVRK